MIGKAFLALLSKGRSIGKACDMSFGGFNMILCGDLHQFPPVANAREALFHPLDLFRDSDDAKVGRALYEDFDTVVVCSEQMRVTDPLWHGFLQNLRYGRVQQTDLDMLRRQIMTHPEAEPIDFDSAPWNYAALVTPRHAVRKYWNEAALRRHFRTTENQKFVCNMESTIQGKPLASREIYCLAVHQDSTTYQRRLKRTGLQDVVELVITMKVTVTTKHGNRPRHHQRRSRNDCGCNFGPERT